MNRYKQAKEHILSKLEKGLPENLYYHNIHHVLDVLNAAEFLAEHEKINSQEMELLKIAVLFHDAGYMIGSQEHEKLSCEMVRDELPAFGYSSSEIEQISKLILATRFPHQPETLLEEIICDADLDYLGRDDFFEIAGNLHRELSIYSMFASEKDWYRLQEKFLNTHRYFTGTARKLRQPKKEAHMRRIREIIETA